MIRHLIAEGNSVVEGAHLDGQLAPGGVFEIGAHSVVVIAHGVGFAHRDRIGLVDAFRVRGQKVHARAQRRLPHEVQTQARRFHQPFAVELDRVAQTVRRLIHFSGLSPCIEEQNRDLTIGGSDLHWICIAGLCG